VNTRQIHWAYQAVMFAIVLTITIGIPSVHATRYPFDGLSSQATNLTPLETGSPGTKDHQPLARRDDDTGLGCDPPLAPPITWSAPISINPGNEIVFAPELAVDSDNRLHAVWHDGSRTVFYASKEPDAAEWTAATPLPGSTNAYSPDVAVDPAGSVHVVWYANSDIFYAIKSPGGAWSSPVNLSVTGKANIFPAIHADDSGNLHVVWSDGSPGNNEIFYRFKSSGASN